MIRTLSGAMGAAALVCATAAAAPHQAPAWRALVAPSGEVRLERAGREMGTLLPGLFEVPWQGASMSPARPGAQAPGGAPLRGQIHAPGGAVVDVDTRWSQADGALRMAYRLTPRAAVRLNSLHVGLVVPAERLAGGSWTADGQQGAFPPRFREVGLRSEPTRDLVLRYAGGAALRLRFAAPTPVLLQDDRQWGQTFSIRIGPQSDGATPWPVGTPLEVAFTLTAEGGLDVEQDGPITVQQGPDWLPLKAELDIEPGSALDFADLTPWQAPAGKLGRVIAAPGGRLAFASRPAEPVRFYGVNLCFSAQYLPHDQADLLATRLRRLGYNAVRLHHYEWELVDRSGGSSTRLNPQALDRLDYLIAALKQRGIYVTTDLFVSRPVFRRDVWEGLDGDVPMDDFKMAVPVNDRAFANFASFTRALLGHENPYTRTRLADDPVLGWLSLINEGNPGNFVDRVTGPLRDDWQRAWNGWLTARYPDATALRAALGGLANGQDPRTGAVPMPSSSDGTPASLVFNVFLAETQRDLYRRCAALLRDELGCKALLTNLNAWTNPVQIEAARADFDYVDDHFYVDHPEFIEQPWQLPSRCPNTSPVAQGAPGGRACAFVRLVDRPFTCSEFNYSGPGRYRGVGGILTGALGAVQDWSVIWRFAYSHSRDNLFQPAPAGYFDMVSDPLSLASERASLCLFRRGDMRAAPHTVAIAMTRADALQAPRAARAVVPDWNWLALVTRVGSLVTDDPGKASADLMVPLGWATPAAHWGSATLATGPYAPETGDLLLREMRTRGWLKEDNPTNPARLLFQSETGELTVDGPNDTLVLATPRTAGGYAPAGRRFEAGAVTVEIADTGATVWVSSLDGRPIAESSRLLITHLTDLQNTGARYGDRARRVLLGWGGLPYLARRGRATLTIRRKDAARARVWGLETSGKRRGEVNAHVANGALVVPLDVDDGGSARMLYEVSVGASAPGARARAARHRAPARGLAGHATARRRCDHRIAGNSNTRWNSQAGRTTRATPMGNATITSRTSSSTAHGGGTARIMSIADAPGHDATRASSA